MRILVAIALSVLLAGCSVQDTINLGGKRRCGTETPLEVTGDPFSAATGDARASRIEGERIVFDWSFGAEDACKDQHVPYKINVVIGPTENPTHCDSQAPRVSVTEVATGGSADFDLGATARGADLVYMRETDLGLAQAATEPTIWYVSVDISFEKQEDPNLDELCAKERIRSVEMSAQYGALPKSGGGAPPTASSRASTAGCGEDMVEASTGIERASSTKQATASDADGRRIYTWKIEGVDACSDQPVQYAMDMTVHDPSSNTACTDSPVAVTLKATTPSGTSDLPITTTTNDAGDRRFAKHGELDLRGSSTGTVAWSMVLGLSIAATDHGALDDACAKDLIAGISFEAAYFRPGP